jgi:hypothetical protein
VVQEVEEVVEILILMPHLVGKILEAVEVDVIQIHIIMEVMVVRV